jgi:hypothetical protein
MELYSVNLSSLLMRKAAIIEISSNLILYVAVPIIVVLVMLIAIGIGILGSVTGTSNVTQMSTSAAGLPTDDVINTKYLEITNH